MSCSKTTTTVGGSGGSTVSGTCPAGEVLIEGRAGAWIDRWSLEFAPLEGDL